MKLETCGVTMRQNERRTEVKYFAAILAVALMIGCAPAAGLKKMPPTWTTQSGYPEVVVRGASPREITGALTGKLLPKGYVLVSGDDYRAAYRAEKQVSLGIRWLPEFQYISTPGEVRVLAAPKIESMGVTLKAKPEDGITHFMNDVLTAIEKDLSK